MKLQDCPPLAGEMCDYDFWLMPKAKAVVEYLKRQPSWRWWNRWINRPKSLSDAGRDNLDEHGYSMFLGWDSFTCRNGANKISRDLYKEFRRVFGRDATLLD